MIPVIIERTGIPPETKVHDLTRQPAAAACWSSSKDFRVDITGLRPVEEAIVTSGGSEDQRRSTPSTMESKKVSGLYFVGELLDVDGYTGGLQPADRLGHRPYAAGRYRGEEGGTEMQK